MDITIQDDGLILPFNLQSSRETRLTILPQTRDATEEKDAADGEIDFGTWLGTGEFSLHSITEFETIDERNSKEALLRKQLNDYRTKQRLTYECSPEKSILVRLTGAPEIQRYPHHLEVRSQFKTDPFWLSTAESSLIGAGSVVNNGTFECPILIEIPGPVTSPSVSVGATVIAYASTVAAGQKLVIDTNTQTAFVSAVASINAIAAITGGIDYALPPGISVAVVPSISTISIKWSDRFV